MSYFLIEKVSGHVVRAGGEVVPEIVLGLLEGHHGLDSGDVASLVVDQDHVVVIDRPDHAGARKAVKEIWEL